MTPWATENGALARAMASDVLEALARVDGLESVIVVTADSLDVEAADAGGALAPALEVVTIPRRPASPPRRLRGVRAAVERGAERVLLVPGDCPAIEPDEVAELLASRRRV